jgi:hypothetical protein
MVGKCRWEHWAPFGYPCHDEVVNHLSDQDLVIVSLVSCIVSECGDY